jgi:ectoine hydroxylase-related dioxygenase (phytanoyl-CoA dioxygenase family)
LEQVIALRLHLDDTPAENGALRVLPGTHKLGRLSNRKIALLRRETQEVVCAVPAGGAMLMSPLLLHASSASDAPSRRRVLHVEFSAALLPGGLKWA